MIDPSLDAPKGVPTLSPVERKVPVKPGNGPNSQNGVSANGSSSTTPPNSTTNDHHQNGGSKEKSARRGSTGLHKSDESMMFLSTASNPANGQDEEAVVYTNTRMLQDPSGRLCKYSISSGTSKDIF